MIVLTCSRLRVTVSNLWGPVNEHSGHPDYKSPTTSIVDVPYGDLPKAKFTPLSVLVHERRESNDPENSLESSPIRVARCMPDGGRSRTLDEFESSKPGQYSTNSF
jgi:hypothetical protein